MPGQLPTTKGWSPGFANSFTPIVAFSYDPAVLESDIYVIAGPVDHARAASTHSTNCPYGLPRPDVPTVFPGFAVETGYEYLLDTTKISSGPDAIVVKVKGATGKVTILGTINATVSD